MAISTGAALIGGGALLGSLGGSRKAGDVSSTKSSAPWAGVQPYLLDVFQRGKAAVDSPFSGPSLAPGGTAQLQNTISGQYLNPQSNPFLGRYVDDALGQVKSAFAGQYGGQAGGNLGNSGYQEMLARTLSNTALPIYANAYNQERQNQLNASQIAPDIDRANMVNPFAPLQSYAQLLSGGTQFGTETSKQPYFNNPVSGLLGGALAGGKLYNMMGGGNPGNALFGSDWGSGWGGIPGYGG